MADPLVYAREHKLPALLLVYDEDGAWIVAVPDAPDLAGLSAFGPTPDAALAEFRIAAGLFIAEYQVQGRPIPPVLERLTHATA